MKISEAEHLDSAARTRLYAALLSVVVSLILTGFKFYAYYLSDSVAVLSDALENIINVAAACFALFSVYLANKPPDRDHPYGHGKVEHFAAIFEGGLIAAAGVFISVEVFHRLMHPAPLNDIGFAIYVVVAAGLINGATGLYLQRIGRRHQSPALVSDGKHLFSDFLTSVGLLVGLIAINVTGWKWLDALTAFIMALILFRVSYKLLREAAAALMDERDFEQMAELAEVFEKHRFPGVINLHHVRVMQVGRRIHIDGHMVVPEHWTVQITHDLMEQFEQDVLTFNNGDGEIEFHFDPCRKLYCRNCELSDCPIRVEEFTERKPFDIQTLTRRTDKTDLKNQ